MIAIRLGLVLLLVSPVAAAPVPAAKPREEAISKPTALLLQQRKVQKELRLTGDQRIALVDGIADIDDDFAKKLDKLTRQPNPTPDIFDKLEDERREKAAKFLAESAVKLLNPETRSRLKQIDRQIRGLDSLADAATQKLLALTDAQKKAIAKAIREQDEKIDAFFNQLGNDDADNAKDELLKFRNERMKGLIAGFTDEQRTLWNSLLGQPVKGFDPIEMWFTLIESDELLLAEPVQK